MSIEARVTCKHNNSFVCQAVFQELPRTEDILFISGEGALQVKNICHVLTQNDDLGYDQTKIVIFVEYYFGKLIKKEEKISVRGVKSND